VKKVLSLVLAMAIFLSTVITSVIVSANNGDSEIKTTVIDFTQNIGDRFVTTTKTAATTATEEDGKLKVSISAYERQLSGITSYNNQTWFPNYMLGVNSSTLHLTKGSKAIVEVKYKVVGTPNVNHGTQIGIANWSGGKGSNMYVRTSKKHTDADMNKEFTLSASYTVDNNTSIKVAFSGGGTLLISSVTVHELPAQYINDHATVKYVDGKEETTEFIKKSATLKTPVKQEDTFLGWYTNSSFTGEAVTSVSADTTLYAKWLNSVPEVENDVKTTVIDLTQSTDNIFATTSKTTSTTATVEDGKLKVGISAYERQLSGATSYSTQTWFPNYLLAKNGSTLHLTKGSKAIVEVKYKVAGTPNVNHGTQIGIANWSGGKGSNMYVRTSKKHTEADMNKEFTLTASYTVDNNTSIKVAFSGGGTLLISSVTVHELPAQYINDYAVVKYVDGEDETTEFVKKNTILKTPVKEENTFIGWYTSSTFIGEAVTSVLEDTTLYAKWSNSVSGSDNNIKTTVIDLTQNMDDFFATTAKTENTTATVEDGKLRVNVSAYERQLSSITSYNNQTWFPNFLLAENGSSLHLKDGSKAIVELKYRVVGTPNANHGVQIGIGNWFGGKGSNIHVRTSEKHTDSDMNKELTFATSFTVDNKTAIKIAFSGGGIIEISSIVVHELPEQYTNDYVVVKYVDGEEVTTEFAAKNGSLKNPVKEYLTFDGWYADKEYSGEKITAVDSDSTLYAKWKVEEGFAVINFYDGESKVTKKYAIGEKIDVTPSKEGYNFLGWYKYSNYVGRPFKTAVAGLSELYAKWEELNPDTELDVNLSKNEEMVTTTKSADSNVKLKNGKLLFDIHNYERQLASTDTSNADSWFPSYYLSDSNGNKVELEIGSSYELQVTYKIVDVKAGDNVGLQIGFGADGQPNQTRTKIKGYAMHKAEDKGKEFNLTTTYTAEKFNFGQVHLPKLLFSGQGELEVKSVKIRKILPAIKDTTIGVQTYEDYKVGTDVGVLGNKKGIEVSDQENHTSGLLRKKSLKLSLNTNYLRLSGNTIISLKQQGELKSYATEKGAAYRITFYMYANEAMDNLTWSISSVDSTLKNDYLTTFHVEVQDKVSLKKGKWQEVTAYIPVLKGCTSSRNLLAIAVCSNGYDGKYVYIDDVKVEQLVDSEVVLYNTMGGEELEPQRAFANQPFLTFKEPVRKGYLFDGWYYDAEYKTEAKVSDKFPEKKDSITLYAKWIEEPVSADDFTAGSFDGEIFNNDVVPYPNNVEDMDSPIECENNKSMTEKVAWVKDAGIYGNGNAETDGALAFCNDYYSSYNDAFGYNVVRLANEDGTPFTVVKGERYTIQFDYIFASHKGLSYIIPVISEHSAYADMGYDSYQTLGRVSVMETDTDYLSYKQSFVAERTGYVYITLTGRDDNANVDTHCYEKVYVDNLKITRNPDVIKLVIKKGDNVWYTQYGVKGEKLMLANAVKEGADTFDGFYSDPEFKTKFNGLFPENDTTIYIKLKQDKYDTPSDFSKPIVLDFEETELLEDFYRQQKYMTSWAREVEKEWSLVTNDAKNALNGKNYIKLNGFSHYWNQAKFALYDVNHPENVMLLDKGGKYRVTVMVRCEDMYEAPVNMTICLENPSQKYLLAENGNVKLEYVPEGDKNGYFMFVGDIEVSTEMAYYPSLAIRRNANDLQSIFIDTVSVEKLRDCTVKFKENGGTDIDDVVVQIHDLLFDPGVPYREGYVFDGWFIDSKFTKKWDFDNDTVEDDMMLYAKWSVEVLEETEDDTSDDSDTENNTPEQDVDDNNTSINDSYYEEIYDLEFDNSEEDFGDQSIEGNGTPPNLLDADAVTIGNADNNTDDAKDVMPLWVIILICAGSALVLSAAGFVTVVLINKKRKNKAN